MAIIWKELEKVDGHVHVVPQDKLKMIKESGSSNVWGNADIENLINKMDKNNVSKAIILPINNSRAYYDMRETNEFMAEQVNKYPSRLIGFADVIIKDVFGMHEAATELEYAVKSLGLKGLKIHPCNLNIPADDLRLIPVLRKAAELNIPVMYHSYPWRQGFYTNSEPSRIDNMIKIFPDINFIIAHIGGMKYMDVIRTGGFVDISMGLFDLVDIHGIKIANNILRKIGVNRLIFATDFPEGSYAKYFEILDEMDFTEDEVLQIAHKNINRILEIYE